MQTPVRIAHRTPFVTSILVLLPVWRSVYPKVVISIMVAAVILKTVTTFIMIGAHGQALIATQM